MRYECSLENVFEGSASPHNHPTRYAHGSEEALSSLEFGKVVSFELLTKDRYERVIAEVFVGQINVYLELVKQEFAWRYDAFLNDPVLLTAQTFHLVLRD